MDMDLNIKDLTVLFFHEEKFFEDVTENLPLIFRSSLV